MIPIAYRHGLRVGELRALTLDPVDFARLAADEWGAAVHPLGGEEVRALRH